MLNFLTLKIGIIMKIEAEIKNIKQILVNDEKFYQIPDYQRPYSWDKDNISDLIDDLVTAYTEDRDDNYFCGSLVLVKNKRSDRFDIIDGQQRTTTFTIISCVFRDLYLEDLNAKAKDYINNSIQDRYDATNRKLKFLTSETYQIDFEETVLKGIDFKNIKNIEKDFPQNRYLQNAHYLKNYIEEKKNDNEFEINDFIIWFYENVVLTVITCPSEESAIQIFNVLNDRGMPLSTTDILKAKLMQKLKDNFEDRQAFKIKWEDVKEKLEYESLSLDDMLNTYLYYKIATNPKSRLDKELLSVFDKEGKNALAIIHEISNFSNKYIALLSANDKYIFCLKYLRHKIFWQSILSTALFVEYKEIEDLKKILVAYYYQNWVSGATVARIKQTSFNILKLVKNKNSITDIKDEMKSNLDKYKTTKSFKEQVLYLDIYGRKWDKAILLLIEYFTSDSSNPEFIQINKKLHIEHILPRTPTLYWKNIFDEDERETWTDALANLTLLSMRKNIQAQNYTFKDKKEAYKDKDNLVTSFHITQAILHYSKWTVLELKEREEVLIKKINEKLDLF